MRKLLLLLISLVVILGALGALGKKVNSPAPKVLVEQPVKPQVQVAIENGETKKEATVSAKNAFEALEFLAKTKNLTLKTKQYDFGVLVESIAGFANTKDKSWIYFVNGKAGEAAADKYELKEGDKVEWKYIKPNF